MRLAVAGERGVSLDPFRVMLCSPQTRDRLLDDITGFQRCSSPWKGGRGEGGGGGGKG